MLSCIGLLIVLAVVAMLLSNRVVPVVALSVVPLVGALAAGFGPAEISQFFSNGLDKVMPTATMFAFAIIYFGVMQDSGLFNPMINRVVDWSHGSVVAIAVGTVLIGAIAHLDGSGASTFLITIPALLPIYKRLNMSPYLLVLLVGTSASIMNMVPWGGPLGRAASVISVDPTTLWRPLIPLQGIALLMLTLMAVWLGFREKRLIEDRVSADSVAAATDETTRQSSSLHLLLFNFLLTAVMIAVLMSGLLPTELIFMIALGVALPVNFCSTEEQMACIRRHAPSALMMTSIIMTAGIFLGILSNSGMLMALAEDTVELLPSGLIPQLHIVLGILGAPLELVLNTDAFYFALLPVVEHIVAPYGVNPQSVAYSMLIGNIIGTFISPFSPALWLAVGLAGIEMGSYIRYAFLWIWGLSIVLLLTAGLMNIF